MNNKKLAILVDGSSLIYRAFYAAPSMESADSEPVGALYGFCTMLISLLNNHEFDFFCIALDCGRKTFRTDLYKEYKAHRKSMPEDLKKQIPLIHEACGIFGVPTVQAIGFEADDIIATYSHIFSGHNVATKMIAVDKDLMQLINENICMFDPVKSNEIKTENVVEKYGVLPEQMTSFQALVGDASDNIPGVPGIGQVTASKLLKEYGSLSDIYENVQKISPERIRKKLEEHKNSAELSLQLATLNRNVNVDKDIASLKINYNHSKAVCFLNRFGFNQLIKRMEKSHIYRKVSLN